MPPTLAVTRVGTADVVHIGATPIAPFPAADVTTRRHVMVQLAEAGRLTGVQIAEQFGVTPVYVSLLRGRYRAHGSAALTARPRGPNGPMKVTPRLVARVRALRAAGLSYRAIAGRLQARTKISHQTVRRILQDRPPAPQARPVADPPPEATAVPSIEIADGETRYAGALLLHVALTQMGLWSVFQTLGASVGRTALSVAQVVGLIAMGFALRLRSIEGFKTALRRDFGRLLGLHVAPAVQTLRTRVHALAESVDPAELMRTLVKSWVALEPVWEGAYYIDGHFCPYSGGRPVPKAWNAKRRLVEPGQTDLYVRPGAVLPEPALQRPVGEGHSAAPHRDPRDRSPRSTDRAGLRPGRLQRAPVSGADARAHRLYHVSEGPVGAPPLSGPLLCAALVAR